MPKAYLVLDDGAIFEGESWASSGETFGEAVFATGMTGYQETLTDPSYHKQVIIMTAPHIGNTGMNFADDESEKIWASGFVVRNPSPRPSSWRSERSLEDALLESGVVGIKGVDTRAITRHLRERGAMRVGIFSELELTRDEMVIRVRKSPQMSGAFLAADVSTKQPYVVHPPSGVEKNYVVAAIDLGIKKATPRYLAERGVEVHVLPLTTTAAEIRQLQPDGLFLSNGPGDPATMVDIIASVRELLLEGMPIFGICFGHQILDVGETILKLAHPLITIDSEINEVRFTQIQALIEEWRPALLVVGLPLSVDGEAHAMTKLSTRFAQRLEGRFSLPVTLVDERFSSAEASQNLKEAGIYGRQQKAMIDQVAAQTILQSYFDKTL